MFAGTAGAVVKLVQPLKQLIIFSTPLGMVGTPVNPVHLTKQPFILVTPAGIFSTETRSVQLAKQYSIELRPETVSGSLSATFFPDTFNVFPSGLGLATSVIISKLPFKSADGMVPVISI